MPLALNIKNPEVAAPDLLEELMSISRRCSALNDLDSRDADEILGYDEVGVFR
jgi:hypothetical protein